VWRFLNFSYKKRIPNANGSDDASERWNQLAWAYWAADHISPRNKNNTFATKRYPLLPSIYYNKY